MSQLSSCKICELLNSHKLAAMQVSGNIFDPHVAYRANQELSGRLWPHIALLEVGVRNRFAEALEKKFGDQFFLDGSRALEARLSERLRFAAKQIEDKGLTNKRNAIVSSLSFGFWAMMLNSRNETKLWVPALRHAFRIDSSEPRQSYYDKMRRVTILRNRIAHHENILYCDEESEIENIVWLLEALEPGSSQFAKLDQDIPLHPVE